MDIANCNPLILTLRLNEEAQLFFNDLRKQYFPAERNFLDAHLTLFHHLPPGETRIIADINQLISRRDVLTLKVIRIASIGNGTAYVLESEELRKLHLALQRQWQQWLTPQDKQKLWPHITVQNKVNAMQARELLQYLSAGFKPFEIRGTGFTLWAYEGGPWKFLREFEFS